MTRRLLVVLALLLVDGLSLTSRAWAVIAFDSFINTQTESGTTLVLTQTAAASGSLMVLMVRVNATDRTITSVVDTNSNTWIAGQSNNVGAGDKYYTFYAANAITTAGANTITVTVSGAAVFIRGLVGVYTGLSTTSPLDQTAAVATGTGTTATSNAVTTTCANEAVIAFIGGPTSHTITGGLGSFTERATTDTDMSLLDRIVSATGTYSVAPTLSASTAWGAFLWSFADVAAPCGAAPDVKFFPRRRGQ